MKATPRRSTGFFFHFACDCRAFDVTADGMLWFVLGFGCLLVGLMIAAVAKRGRRQRDLAHEAQREFWVQTGYAHTSLLGAPLAMQLAYAAPSAAQDYTAQLPNGAVVRYQAHTHWLADQPLTAAAWTLAPAHAMLGGWQIVSRDRIATHAPGGLPWQPLYPPMGPVGDADFDTRLVVFARTPSRAKLLLSDRTLQRKLLRFAAVDVIASATQVAFFDPSSKNLQFAGADRKRRPAGVAAQVAVHIEVRDALMLLADLERVAREPSHVRYDC